MNKWKKLTEISAVFRAHILQTTHNSPQFAHLSSNNALNYMFIFLLCRKLDLKYKKVMKAASFQSQIIALV